MSTIVLRSVKGTPLTNTEVDTNFSNLNTDKLEAATSATLTNKTINLTSNTLVATSAQLATAVTDETGSGSLVFGTAPVFGGKVGFGTSAAAATVHVAGSTILSNVNVLGATYDNVSFSVTAEDATPTDLFFSPDGLKMYVLGNTGDDINEYTLTTAWLVSSAVFVTNFSVASQDGTPQGMFFRADGTKMYMVGTTNDTVYQYTLSNPWSVATASYDSISFSVAAEGTPAGLWFKPNGLSMYMVGSTGDAVYQYTLSTAWNVSTATFLQSFSISGQETVSNSVVFTGDGSRMFVMGQTGDDVNVYNLTTPWNISTATFVNVFSVSGQDTFPTGLYIKPDGTKMYMVGTATDTVYQYTVPSIDIQLTGQTSVAGLDVQQDLNVYGSTTGFFRNNGFRENIGGQYYNLVSQTDIGTAANEIPLNQYLGNLAYQDAANIAGPVGVGGALTVVGATTLSTATATTANITSLNQTTEIGNLEPTLDLPFALTKQLDPRITFTRASTATYYGTQTAKAEENLVTYSQDFNQWTKVRVTFTGDTTAAPDGTTTADTITNTATTGTHEVDASVGSVIVSGLTYTISVFAKKNTNDFFQITTFNASNTLGIGRANFNLATGVVGTVDGGTSTITSVGNGWYRCTYTVTASASGSVNIYAVIVTSSTAARFESYTGLGTESIYLWGAQLEQRSAATAYTATTTQSITNYIPQLLTAASGVARFDHNPTTFESLGLLIEESRTNLLTYSEQFDNAAWNKNASTVSANTIVSPDGAVDGDKLVEDTSTNGHYVFQNISGASSGAVYGVSIYLKAAERSFAIVRTEGSWGVNGVTVNLSSGVASSATGTVTGISSFSVGNGWWRVSFAFTAAATSGAISVLTSTDGVYANRNYAGNGYSGIYIWGAQLEAGAFATSYIPTTTASVTRAADAASMTGTNFSSWYNQGEGALYVEAQTVNLAANRGIFAIGDSSLAFGAANTIYSVFESGLSGRISQVALVGGLSQVASMSPVYTQAANTATKMAQGYKVNDYAITVNAVNPAVDPFALVPAVSSMSIGSLNSGWLNGGNFLNGTIKQITYFPKRLPDAELQEMTA